MRYVAKFQALKNQEELQRIVNTSLAIFSVAGSIVLAITSVLLFPGWPLLHVPRDLEIETWWLLALLGLNMGVGLPLGIFAAVLDGIQRFVPKVVVLSATSLIQAGLCIAIVWRGGGLIALALAITVTSLVSYLALAILGFRYLPTLRFSLSQVDRNTFRMIRGYSLDAFFAMLAGRISFQTDALVIGAFLAPEPITYFVIAARLVEHAKSMMRSMTTVLTPTISGLEALGDLTAIRRILIEGSRAVLWIVLPFEVGFWILGRPFLALWMGPKYATQSSNVLSILAIPLALTLSQSISGRILYGIGRLRFFMVMVLIEALANLLMSTALVRPLGIQGVAWGTAVPNVAFNLAVACYVCRILGVSIGEYVRRSFLLPLCIVPLLVLTWIAALWVVPSPGWIQLLVIGCLGLAVYVPCSALAELGPARIMQLLGSLAERLKSATGSSLSVESSVGRQDRG